MKLTLGRNRVLHALAASPLVPFIQKHEEAEEGVVVLVISFALVWMLLAFGAGVASAAVVSTLSTSPTVHLSPGKSLAHYVYQTAPRYGLDPAASLAVSTQEGGGGGIGDYGTSFGPWQLHYGGALPSSVYHGPYSPATQAWAWSTDGVNYALRHQAAVCHGLTGYAAVACIVARFERSAVIARETAGAWRAYGFFHPPAHRHKLSKAAKLRLRHQGYHSWLDWSLGVGPWKGYKPFTRGVRPAVRRNVPLAWWRRRATYVRHHG